MWCFLDAFDPNVTKMQVKPGNNNVEESVENKITNGGPQELPAASPKDISGLQELEK